MQKAITPLQQTNMDGHQGLGKEGRSPTASAIAQLLWVSITTGLDVPAADGLSHLKLIVRESDMASAEFARPLPPAGRRAVELAEMGAALQTPAAASGTHTLVARGRCMIAHSFRGDEFGPAQALHGCTYEVEARLSASRLLDDGEIPCTRGKAAHPHPHRPPLPFTVHRSPFTVHRSPFTVHPHPKRNCAPGERGDLWDVLERAGPTAVVRVE